MVVKLMSKVLEPLFQNNARVLYTDGGCREEIGGWAFLERVGDDYKNLKSGGDKCTTNNRMELIGAIEGIKSLPLGSNVIIYTDSSYVATGFHHPSYLQKWVNNGWKTSKRQPVENQDLWNQILYLSLMYNLRFIRIKGHSKDSNDPHRKYNDIVDRECTRVITELREEILDNEYGGYDYE